MIMQVGWTHPDSITFMVMQSLLGSWDRTSGAGQLRHSLGEWQGPLASLWHGLAWHETVYSQ